MPPGKSGQWLCVWARAKFDRGDRIRVTLSTHKLHREGVVVGYGRLPHLVRIVLDGTKTPQTYHMDFIEKIESLPAGIPQDAAC